MSRIGKMPIPVPSSVTVDLGDGTVRVKGPKGELERQVPRQISIVRDDGVLRVERSSDEPTHRSLHGLTRSLVANMVTGVTKGFEKKLTIIGVGFRAAVQGKKLNLTVGYSHPIVYAIPDGITIEAPDQTNLIVRGADKQLVGQVAAEIRGFRPPEPYKGKGVRYIDEQIVRKEAKKK